MTGLLALTLAASAGPMGDAHLYGAIGDVGPGVGVGVGVAGPVGPIHLEGAADIGAIGSVGLEVHGWGLLRWFWFGIDPQLAPSLRVGPGLRFAEASVAPEALAGVALDLPRMGDVRLRVGVDGIGRLGGPWTGRLTLALVGSPGPGKPARTPSAVFDDPTGEASVWLPHPFCQWVPASDVGPWLAALPPGQPLKVRAPGYVPVEAPADALAEVTLQRAPEHGSVIVVASPGDHIRLGPDEYRAPHDGVVVLDLPVGLVEIDVVGAGRATPFEAAVVDGYVVWLRPEQEPGPIRVAFPVGRSALDDAGRALVSTVAASAGSWSFTVQGLPGGARATDLRLADQRGKAVADALVAAGLAGRVTVLPARAGDASLPADAVVVTPIPPEAP